MLIHDLARRADIKGVAAELAKGIPVDSRDETDSYTPLMCALSSPKASAEIVRFLIGQGANANVATGESRETPLQHAVQSGDLALVQLVLEAGADTTT